MKCQRGSCGGEISDGACLECGRPPAGGPRLVEAGAVRAQAPRQVPVIKRSSGQRKKMTAEVDRTTGISLAQVQPLPPLDPLTLVMKHPEVPKNRRICPKCEHGVTEVKGFCCECGAPYDFAPSLKAGDRVGERFEVKGPIALGGLGWIYLARDLVLSRWVVLKGLLNGQNDESVASATAERQFLAAVKHPKIVAIHDFITHEGSGYIILEYVNGRTVGSLRKEKGPLPVAEALAYTLDIMPAFSYLHQNNYVYCDFKPENFMYESSDVKLIDMGSVRRLNDSCGDIFGTRGFTAPEAEHDPTPLSDLYSIGRTLACLVMDFDHQGEYEWELPPLDETPLLQRYASLHRLLLRATHLNPDQRFQSAEEFSGQLMGVLREVVATTEMPQPWESQYFTGDNLIGQTDDMGTSAAAARCLPSLKLQQSDPAAHEILALGGAATAQQRIDSLQQLIARHGSSSTEASLRLADALIARGDSGQAEEVLEKLASTDPFEWRVHWYRGKYLLDNKEGAAAAHEFQKVFSELPGELAPKLALANAAECAGELQDATRYYELVARVNPTLATACFGLARCRIALRDSEGGVAALSMVPASHSMFVMSRVRMVQVLLFDERTVTRERQEQAAKIIKSLPQDVKLTNQLIARLFFCTLRMIRLKLQAEEPERKLLGTPITSAQLQNAAAEAFRQAAKSADDAVEYAAWIDLANSVRPLTLF